jgi:teichuronic acid biosynthesis glycosyltransferase TuaG
MLPLRFSVVIPTYNSARYLEQTLDCVIQQSYPYFEVLIVDDASTDATIELASRYSQRDQRFKVWQLHKNSGGPAVPRNRGIALSQNDYIAFLDSDDLWRPQKLENDAAYLEKYQADALFSGAQFFTEDPGRIIYELKPCKVNFRILFRNSIAMSTLCVRRDIFNCGRFLFDPDPLLVAIEDYNLIVNLYLSGKTVASRPGSDTLYRFNSPTSISQNHKRDLVARRAMYNLGKLSMQHSFSFGKLFVCSIGLLAVFTYRKFAGRM